MAQREEEVDQEDARVRESLGLLGDKLERAKQLEIHYQVSDA